MKRVAKLLICPAVMFSTFSCQKPGPVAIDRLEVAASSPSAMSDTTIARYSDALTLLGRIYGTCRADSAMAIYSTSAAQRVFAPDVMQRMPSLDTLEYEIGQLLDNLSANFPEEKLPSHIVTFVTPYNQSIFVSDTTLLIALNHYMGADYEGYRDFEPYQRAFKTPERISIDVAEAIIASRYPFEPSGSVTALSRMLYEGAILNNMAAALPRTDEATLLGYTPGQYQWSLENEGRAWEAAANGDLLYSTDPTVADRLLLPSPATTIINANAPGRLGRFMGYRIVKSYLENNSESTPASTLSPLFYSSAQTLQKARYAP